MYSTAQRDAALATMTTGHYATLLTAITNFRTGSVTEAAGARKAITFGAAADTSPAYGRQVANSAAVVFDQNISGSTVNVIGYAVFSAVSAGTLKAIGLFGSLSPFVGLVDDTTNDDILAASHGMAADQKVYVMGVPGATIPAGLSENTIYYVIATGLTTDKFRLSTSQGGAAVNITARGACFILPYSTVGIADQVTPQLDVGAIVLQY